jgi:hypothetical protein
MTKVLVIVYAIFALSASARAAVQIASAFDEAPLAYSLSALAGLVYLVAAVALARPGRTARRVAIASLTFELLGVLAVGTASLITPESFPDETVWSVYGRGYGFVPLVLPVVGLAWILRSSRTGQRERQPATRDG